MLEGASASALLARFADGSACLFLVPLLLLLLLSPTEPVLALRSSAVVATAAALLPAYSIWLLEPAVTL
jgi:hypothetical protein